jgi:glycogen debranching enzyme
VTVDRSTERGTAPYLHNLVVSLSTPGLAMSPVSGQLTGENATGFYLSDRRVLSRLVLTVGGESPEPLLGRATAAATARFVGVARSVGDNSPDPTVVVERRRSVMPDSIREVIIMKSRARAPVTATLGLELQTDLADVFAVRDGIRSQAVASVVDVGAVRWQATDGATVVATLLPPADEVTASGDLLWEIGLGRDESWSLTVDVALVDDPVPAVLAPPTRTDVVLEPAVRCFDRRLAEFVRSSVADVTALIAADAEASDDHIAAAGAPWYLTMFGRDAIWTARLLLPLGTELAGGTLRALARRQGQRDDPLAEEQPGKIIHEVRRGHRTLTHVTRSGRALALAPRYYGTVDATPLWICLLHDAWRWGLPADDVRCLLPALNAALDWLARATRDGDGFVQYASTAERGLVNHGWKDTADAVQFADGTRAEPPVALCEVQGYAYEAARGGAELLAAFNQPNASTWQDWAAELRDRFRARFWVSDEDDGYPAIAVDGSGRPVDTVTSNIGHLLGTGLLDDEEADRVVRHLARADMDSGLGLRTMSSLAAGFNPNSYHCGSVWPHDTAITLRGLYAVRSDGAQQLARRLIEGLLHAAAAFDFRLPELYGGESVAGEPVPYPVACRPQAWSAAAAVAALSAILGLDADVPGGQVTVRPLRPSPVGELTVSGLRVGDDLLDLALSAAGDVDVVRSPRGLTVTVR